MSLVFTESWAPFATYTGLDSDATAKTAFIANWPQWGYTHTMVNNLQVFVVRADPLFPTRKMLTMASSNPGSTNLETCKLTMDVPASDKPFVMGFAMWVPSEYVPVPVGVAATPNIFKFVLGGVDLFFINSDLTARTALNAAAQSSRFLKTGQMNYVEFRYDPFISEVRVWFDDVLVLQQTVRLALGQAAFSMVGNGISNNPGRCDALAGRFGFSHVYALLEDNMMPNLRLGPTTRVIGVRPSTDTQAQWAKPSGQPSNAAVVGSDIVLNPVNTLQTETVGATDFYTGTADGAVASATLVHGVTMKVQAANLDTTRHSIKAVARVGVSEGEGNVTDVPSLKKLNSFTTGVIYSACPLTSGGVIVGLLNDDRVIASDALDLGTYVRSANVPSNSTYIVAIARNAAGRVVALTNGAILYYGDEVGSSVPAWSAPVTHGLTAGFDVCVNPADGNFYATGNNQNLLRRSSDGGVTWTTASTISGSTNARRLAIKNGVFLAITTNGSSAWFINRATAPTGPWTSVFTLSLSSSFSDPQICAAPIMIGNNGLCVAAFGESGNNFYFYRSADNGLTWAAVTGTIVSGTYGARCGVFIEDGGTGGGYFVVGFAGISVNQGGPVLISRDGNNWVVLQAASTFDVKAIAPLPAGKGFVVYGSAGVMQAYTSQIVDYALAPLGGYSKVTQFMTINPQTGLPWTGSQAAAAEFGMRLAE